MGEGVRQPNQGHGQSVPGAGLDPGAGPPAGDDRPGQRPKKGRRPGCGAFPRRTDDQGPYDLRQSWTACPLPHRRRPEPRHPGRARPARRPSPRRRPGRPSLRRGQPSTTSQADRSRDRHPLAPIPHDPRIYKLRNRIECCFNRLKRFRRFATRFDRLAAHHLAFTHIAASMLWMC